MKRIILILILTVAYAMSGMSQIGVCQWKSTSSYIEQMNTNVYRGSVQQGIAVEPIQYATTTYSVRRNMPGAPTGGGTGVLDEDEIPLGDPVFPLMALAGLFVVCRRMYKSRKSNNRCS